MRWRRHDGDPFLLPRPFPVVRAVMAAVLAGGLALGLTSCGSANGQNNGTPTPAPVCAADPDFREGEPACDAAEAKVAEFAKNYQDARETVFWIAKNIVEHIETAGSPFYYSELPDEVSSGSFKQSRTNRNT